VPSVQIARGAVATAVVVAAAACGFGVAQRPSLEIENVPLGLDSAVPTPVDNQPNPAKLALGERLFLDPVLSIDGTRSCASCHRPERAYSDDEALSQGIRGQSTTRNAPALINRAWGRSFFRDGRATTLEATVLQPVVNTAEMGLELSALEERLSADSVYSRQFGESFGSDPRERPTSSQAAAALAAYIRSIRSGDSPVDRFAAGDSTALTLVQREGRELFLGKAGCAACHLAPNFTDERFHNTGIAVGSRDPGRLAVTGDPRQRGAFRTPTLRDIALTAPYMHDGSKATLTDVVDFYDDGGVANPNLDLMVRPLGLTGAEKLALVAFLEALTGSR
jgi:cytochrome c peroxidase